MMGLNLKEDDDDSFGLIRRGVLRSPSTERKSLKNEFTRLEAECKRIIQTAFNHLHSYRKREAFDPLNEFEESQISDLTKQARENIPTLKSISEDMSTIYKYKSLSPRVVDQAKTYALSVDGLQATLRKLLLDFQNVANTKHRQDLLSLSRSPFEERTHRRFGRGGAAQTATGMTDSLMTSQQILSETLQRSQGTLEQLTFSAQNIQANQDELRAQTSVVNTAQKLLAKYGRREWTDKVLICLALCFFFACVLYIVQKRLF